MHNPTPNEHHQRLARLAGHWVGTEHMHPSQWVPEGCTCDSEVRSRVDLGGFCVVTDYRQSNGGETTYSGHGVYTIDPQSNEVVMHWFDTLGGQHEEFRGSWDGDVLTTRSKNPMGFMRMTYDLSTDGVMRSRGEMSADGEQWSTMFDGELRRQG